MDRRKVEELYTNAQTADHDTESSFARFTYLQLAQHHVIRTYIETFGRHCPPPDYFEDAVSFAVNLLYEAGVPFRTIDDITGAIDNRIEWMHQNQVDDWLPRTNEETLTVGLLTDISSRLAIEDDKPAYGPHIKRRVFEVFDEPTAYYNKFGLLINHHSSSDSIDE